ncbi:Cysteine protease rd19a [Turnera subulata]|uniref:Cysteine protease rd19a n=1 Tax=Turnera subulata TaxID=218843 RepID=A0A9Q0J008_9ROSI|nr:Cysteine protease rd19a [Turnera subulata]
MKSFHSKIPGEIDEFSTHKLSTPTTKTPPPPSTPTNSPPPQKNPGAKTITGDLASFKSKFGKSYASAKEHDYRQGVFKANLRRARRHQAMDPSAVHEITKFSDLTPKKFRRQFLGLKKGLGLPKDANKAPILPTNDLPTDFDWW